MAAFGDFATLRTVLHQRAAHRHARPGQICLRVATPFVQFASASLRSVTSTEQFSHLFREARYGKNDKFVSISKKE
jgi:hypothetical protein